MKITGLDFFSEPPQINYCKKETNQTFFGGVLFFIYIGVMIIISVVYTCDYFMNDKYEIQYTLIKNTEIDLKEMNKKDELNPMITFSIELRKISSETKLSERFALLDLNSLSTNPEKIERGTYFKRRPNDFNFAILYICEDEQCTLDQNDTDPIGYML